MKRELFSSDAPWEPVVGYSRAVKVGPWVLVSGTTATDDQGKLVGLGDPDAQTRQALKNIEAALMRAGSGLQDVVRTRIYVKDKTQWETIGRVHGEIFHAIRPASALVEVSGFVNDNILVEIEADAVIHE